MPIPKVAIPKIQPFSIPWFKQYLLITIGLVILLGSLTVYMGMKYKDYLLYPRTSIEVLVKDVVAYKDKPVGLQGSLLDFTTVQKPLCVPQGGTQLHPFLRSDYHPIPALIGLTDGSSAVAIKVISANGEEYPVQLKSSGQQMTVRGTIRLTTTLDDCNYDISYQSAYLEVSPAELGLKDPTKQ